jgi:hypothetical protein
MMEKALHNILCPFITRTRAIFVLRVAAVLFISLFCQPGFSQDLESMSSADLYRLIAQLENESNYEQAAQAYRLLAERDLAK